MRTFSILCAFLGFCFISCTFNKKDYIKINWEDTCTLGMRVLNDTSLFKYPRQMECFDTILIVMDDVDSHFLHLYNTVDGSLIQNFARKGQGPGELLSAERFHLSVDKKKLSVYDIMSNKIVTYKIDSILLGKMVCEEFRVEYGKLLDNKMLTIVYDMIPYNDSLYIVKANNDNMRYGLFSSKNDDISILYTSYIMDGFDYNSKDEVWSVFSSNTSTFIKPDRTRLVNATKIGAILEIFDINAEELNMSSRHNMFLYEPIYGIAEGAKPVFVVSNENTLLGFENIYVTDNYIYALLYDSDVKMYPNSISIFDWDCKPIKKIYLDKSVRKLCVDEVNRKIYLLAISEENCYELNVLYY